MRTSAVICSSSNKLLVAIPECRAELPTLSHDDVSMSDNVSNAFMHESNGHEMCLRSMKALSRHVMH